MNRLKPEFGALGSAVSSVNLNFFPEPDGMDREKQWRKTAQKILSLLVAKENVGLIADTGTGKTNIAYLVAVPLLMFLERNVRMLFLTPTRPLTDQQWSAFQKLTEPQYELSSALITGETRIHARDWKNPRIIFSTPQTITHAPEALDGIDLIFFDECHHATGNYDYVKIGAEAQRRGIPTFSFSAVPGDTQERINEIKRNLGITKFVNFSTKMPIKLEQLIEVPMDFSLKEIDGWFQNLFIAEEKIMRDLGVTLTNKTSPMKIRDLFTIKRQISGWEGIYREYYSVISSMAVYQKLLHMYSACVIEGYGTFFESLEKLRTENERKGTQSRASQKILNDVLMKKITAIAKMKRKEHPKTTAFKEHIRNFPENGTSIIFVKEKATGKLMHDWMKTNGHKSEFVVGGKDRDVNHIRESKKKLGNREINHLIATSVIREGIHVSQVNQVINYSHPNTVIEQVQGNGRTARTEIGKVVNIILDHPMDKARFYILKRKESFVKRLWNPETAFREAHPEQTNLLFKES